MVATRHDMKVGARAGLDDQPHFVFGPERVTTALHEEHRRADRPEMRVVAPFGSSRRVEWIPEQDEPRYSEIGRSGYDLRRDPTSH